jgi:hypothetical protein
MLAQVEESEPLPARALPDFDVEPPALGADPPSLDDVEPLDEVSAWEPDEPPAAGAPSLDPAPFPSPVAPSLAPAVAADEPDGADRASFLAQPLPLKWIAGVLTAFFIAPPQTSQVAGPVPEIEWTTSTECPQAVQR